MFARVVASIALACGAAYADPTSSDPVAAAKQYVDAGLAAQKSGDYATAIEMYEKANELAPHPVLFFNMAQAHRLASGAVHDKDSVAAAQHRDAARELYRKFLDSKPEGDLEVTARGWLAKLDQQWADENPKEEAARRAEQDRKREDAINRERERLAIERHATEARDELERQRIGTAVTHEKREGEITRGTTLEWIGGGAATAGVVAAGIGVVFGVKARNVASSLTTSDTFDVQQINHGNDLERDMVISYVAGGTLLVGGAVVYWFGHRARAAAEHISITPGAGGGTVSVRGSW